MPDLVRPMLSVGAFLDHSSNINMVARFYNAGCFFTDLSTGHVLAVDRKDKSGLFFLFLTWHDRASWCQTMVGAMVLL